MDSIEMLLANYDALIGDAAELAAEWAEMDEQEQIHHRSISMQIWGMRRTLGSCYQPAQLHPMQVGKSASRQVGKSASRQVGKSASCSLWIGLYSDKQVSCLLNWGTPLSKESGTIQLDLPLRILPTLAQVLAREAVGSR